MILLLDHLNLPEKDGTPLITDDMTLDSHRWNADIDPTVLIDDDGTPWMHGVTVIAIW